MPNPLRDCLPFLRAPKPAAQPATAGIAPIQTAADSLPSGRIVHVAPPGTPRIPRRSAWSSVKDFFSRQFHAVAACFGRRTPSQRAGDSSTPPRAESSSASGKAGPNAPLPTSAKLAEDNLAPSDVANVASSSANTPPTPASASAAATPASPATPAAQAVEPAAAIEQKPPLDLALGDEVLWKPNFSPPRHALITAMPNPRFATIRVEEGGEKKTYFVDRSSLHPWNEEAERLVGEAAAEETAQTAAREETVRQMALLPPIPRTRADAIAEHAKHFPPVTVMEVGRVEANHKLGSYVKLGETDAGMVKDAFGRWIGTQPDELLLQQHEDALRNLPPEAMDLIHRYVSSCGENKEMRGGVVTKSVRDLSSVLHRVCLPLPAGMELKRNLGSFPDKRKLLDLEPGTIIQSPQFDSLSLPSGLYGEKGNVNGKNDHEVQMRLVTAEGVRGIYIGKSSIMASEEEVLLPENTRYAIHSVTEDPGTGRYIVEAVVLPTVEGKLE